MPATASKLIFISLTPNFGGHEVMLTRWMQEVQAATDVVPHLVCNQKSKLASLSKDNNIECTPLTWPPAWSQKAPGPAKKLLALTYLVFRLARIRRQTGATVAVASEGSLMSEPLAILAARLVFKKAALYVPMVDTYQDLGYPDAEGATKRFMRFYRHLPSVWITLSQGQAAIFKKWANIQQPVFVLQNTISQNIDHALKKFKANSLLADVFKILILGRLDAKHKGLDFLFSYLKTNAEALIEKRFQFHFVGDGPYRTAIEEIIRSDKKIAQLVEMQPWSDPIQCFQTADCTLLTSRYEGVPLVMLESMALGIPMVASRLPGVEGYLHPACQFEIGDISTAIDAIEKLRSQEFRNEVIAFNKARYEKMASAKAFRECVTTITAQLTLR
ncbi:MAG: glycosyltransferase [Rubrivivax sp.]|nr:MAG: glycosyltransferase [Rubrivivax sp.]